MFVQGGPLERETSETPRQRAKASHVTTASLATPTPYRSHQYHPSPGLPALEGDRSCPGDRPKKADERQRPRLPSDPPGRRASQRRTGGGKSPSESLPTKSRSHRKHT